MSVVINTNLDSTKIQNSLTGATNSLSKTMERMSSGLKVASAKDDAAGCVISARMKVQLNGNKIAQSNVQNANALLSTTEGNLDVVADNVSRIRDLTMQAKNGTYSLEEIQAMDDEVQQRIAEINRISYSSKFSSSYLFHGGKTHGTSVTTGLSAKGATFQTGSNTGDDNTIKADEALFQSVEFSAMSGIANFSLSKLAGAAGGLDVSYNSCGVKYITDGVEYTVPTFKNSKGEIIDDAKVNPYDKAIAALDTAIDNITNRKSIIGSAANRLESALSSLTSQFENLESANSLIVDSDIAADASKYTQASILQQVSTSLLSQANQAPSIALSLV